MISQYTVHAVHTTALYQCILTLVTVPGSGHGHATGTGMSCA